MGRVKADNLPESPSRYKRAASHARGVCQGLSDYADITAPGVSFGLSGPGMKLDPAHLPVRGDLAHIRFAGKVFVQHYVGPLAHAVNGSGATLRSAGRDDAEILADLPTGTPFNVLDVSGGWAWGQIGEDGLVGYVPAAALHPVQ